MGKKRRIVGRPWTAEEISLLKELYPASPTDELAKRLGRSEAAVKHRAYSLGVKRQSWRDKLWTAEELEMLRTLYPNCKSTREIAKKIGRPWGSVRQIASNLGISKVKRLKDYGDL